MKLRPTMSGCSVRTKTPTRQSGSPAATSRSHSSDIICVEVAADLAPSISQSLNSCISVTVMEAYLGRKFRKRQDDTIGDLAASDPNRTVAILSRSRPLLAHLPAMAQEMIGEHAGHHGFSDRHRSDADA